MTSQDRKRTNILKSAEHRAVQYFCSRLPQWVTPDMLTAFGFFGSLVAGAGLWLGGFNRFFLLFAIIGLVMHWLGDSLDGRLAYYRNRPRKWYGWALDINTDLTSVCIIGLGFYLYLTAYKIVAFVFVAAYCGSMIIALLRYKITNKYTIDSFYLGPTELRMMIALFLLIEIFRPGALLHFGFAGSLLLLVFNLLESYKLLRLADQKDRDEKLLQNDFGSGLHFTNLPVS